MIDLDVLQARAGSESRRCAVGGLIRDERGRIFVHRRGEDRVLLPGCWDIPGGHVEPGERLLAALEREVAEETGWRLVGTPHLIFVSDWETTGPDGVDRRREFDFLVEVEGDLAAPRLEWPRHTESAWVDADSLDLLDENRGADDGLMRRLVTSALYWPDSDQPSYPHATVYLAGDAAGLIEPLRQRWDPVMAAGVRAHVTVGYPRDVTTLDDMVERTRRAASIVEPFRVALGGVATDAERETVFVRARDVDGGLGRLRAQIIDANMGQADAWVPHITIVHPRTSNRGPAAWEHLRAHDVVGEFDVAEVHVTALRGTCWQTAAAFDLSEAAHA